MHVELSVTAGPAKGKRFTFDKPDHFLFGRAAEAHISLPKDLHVSRQHFLVDISPTECILRDLNSKNGVVVNGIHYGRHTSLEKGIKQAPNGIKDVHLRDGDEIVVGETRIKVSIQRDSSHNETLSDETIVYTVIGRVTRREVALLLFDLVQSTQYVLDMGDTNFSALIMDILKRVRTHTSASQLIFLKSTGDGFLAVFHTIPAAFSLASMFLETPIHPDMHIRMALHWGTIKTSPDGNVRGAEVNRLKQIEGIQIQDQVAPVTSEETFPTDNRLLITEQGLERLNDSDQARFRLAGTFRVKNFTDLCNLWVLYKATE